MTTADLDRPTGERRYRVLDVLGRGGQGVVYRAEMFGAEGFRKQVALKLLNDASPPLELLQRLRDEARLLGLLRDRAIVSADPPTQLNGRWAVVMELVDGCSLHHLRKALGTPLPPSVALEVVAEVARALDRAWHQPGPTGDPLHLVHRDIKPANIQITAMGDIKLLDFGIARTIGFDREAHTETGGVYGTSGYIAPERFVGIEVEQTDVFSLGVVLWQLLTGGNPDETVLHDEEDVDLPSTARNLARRMVRHDPQARPVPREVERHAIQLARREGPTLREWAEMFVPEARRLAPDAVVGSVLGETLRVTATSGPVSRKVVGTTLFLASSGAAMATAVLVVGLGLAVWMVLGGDPPAPESGSPVAITTPASEPPPRPRGSGAGEDPDDDAVATPTAIPAAPTPDPQAERAAPAPPPRSAPVPAAPTPLAERPEATPPAPTTPEAAPAAAPTRIVRLGSTPPGAAIVVDGRDLPRPTPLFDLELEAGTHVVRMTLDGTTLSHTFTVGPFAPEGHTCNFEEAACFSF